MKKMSSGSFKNVINKMFGFFFLMAYQLFLGYLMPKPFF